MQTLGHDIQSTFAYRYGLALPSGYIKISSWQKANEQDFNLLFACAETKNASLARCPEASQLWWSSASHCLNKQVSVNA